MSAAAAQPLLGSRSAALMPVARRVTSAVLLAGAVLGLLLLGVSLIPSPVLASRLLGADRIGAFAQELNLYADDRLRLAGALVLAFTAGLALLRGTLEELVAASSQFRVAWPDRHGMLMVAVTTVAAAAVRIPFLSQPMRYDEALTFNEFASRPLYYGLSFYPDPNNHLLNTALMHLTFLGLGNQPWVLRLPAFVAGVLLVPATFWLASEFFGPRAATLAAALVAVSSYLVEYSTNGRGYTLQALCFVLMLSFVMRGGALVFAALVAAVGAYALPTMLYGVAIAAACLVWRRTSARDLLTAGLLVGLLVTVLYTPVIVVSGQDKVVGNRFVVPLGLSELPGELAHSLTQTWSFWNRDIPLPLSAVLLLGFAIVTVQQVRARQVPIGPVAVATCLVLVLLQRVAPFERVWLFLLPLYLALAAGGLARFVDGRVLALIFGLVMGYMTLTSGSILASQETGVFPDAEAVAETLGPRLAPDDAVMTTLPASLPELQYYFPRSRLPIDVLVRAPNEAQNLWVITPLGADPHVDGWPNVTEVARFSGSDLFELRR